MEFSGVGYTNLNGEMVISVGRGNHVHKIVEGEDPETEIIIKGDQSKIKGAQIDPAIVEKIKNELYSIEDYFGIPMDVEFALLKNRKRSTLLQARPLPNPTEAALKEHELRKLEKITRGIKNLGLEEIVLGIGNYREIIGQDEATLLSVSTFNYIFSGDGKSLLGGMQLGRNELGYDNGYEIFPWVVMIGGRIYYNFAADALQFRPEGIELKNLLHVINKVYIPIAKSNPVVLNYPELQLYIQFPEQAEKVGLDPEPYKRLVEKNIETIKNLVPPQNPPKKRIAPKFNSLEKCLEEIRITIEDIRTESGRVYVKATRFGYFALDDLRIELEKLKEDNPTEFKKLADLYSIDGPTKLRDAIAYDESIISFEVPRHEEYRYQGSFELSFPRRFPPKRHFKQGKYIPNKKIRGVVQDLRKALENREKVKFFLFRDFDYLKQLYDQFGELSGLGTDVYHLELDALELVIREPTLAYYRLKMQKRIIGKKLFKDPLFESETRQGSIIEYEKHPQLIFGFLPENKRVHVGQQGYLVRAVDQTTQIPENTEVVFVPDNVRPGSHLFTVLSDYNIPVVAVPCDNLLQLEGKSVEITKNGSYLKIEEIKE